MKLATVVVDETDRAAALDRVTERLTQLRGEPGLVGWVVLAARERDWTAGIAIWADGVVPDDVPEARPYEVAQLVGVTGAGVARVTQATLNPGNLDRVIGVFQNVVMHAATSQKGFRRGLLLVDRDRDEGLSIGFWEDESVMLANQSGYFRRQVEQFTGMFLRPPITLSCDVLTEVELGASG